VRASVVICSRNRVESLLETLRSLDAMRVPPGLPWEVVVVDNASTDGTAGRVREFAAGASVPVVVLEEPQPGKAYALNRALSGARGEVLLFTDDDAILDRGWLAGTLEAFERSGADCVGGRVVPLWLAPRPPWLTDRLLNILAMLDLGPEPRELTGGRQGMLYGVNYAFRREVFEQLGGFDTKLCARGCGNEDFEMLDRLQAAGGRVYYDPSLLVEHKVFPERLTRAYFRRWHRLWGRDRAQTLLPGRRQLLGLEGYMLRGFLETAGRLTGAALRLDGNEVFYQELRGRLYLSYIRARLGQYLSGRLPAPAETVSEAAGVAGGGRP